LRLTRLIFIGLDFALVLRRRLLVVAVDRREVFDRFRVVVAR
jgi:hypothetical protein